MFHLVKLVFLLSILSGTANAQWGTVVAQSDTNRFITSQYNYGLVMPHQEVIVGLLDTTITSAGIGGGNAFKVIVGSLLDYEDNCANYSITNGVASCAGSYELWRELEKSTSWYQADRGDTTAMFPTNYAITISTGKDSVNIWNRDTAELWMAFVGGGSNLLRIAPPSNPIKDFAFKDGQFYAATESYAFGTWDMLESYKPTFYSTDGAHQLEGVDIQTRNDGTQTWGGAFGSGTLAIVNTNVNGVGVVRDPFGIKDALGRPKHWWVVATAGGISTYNPHANTISNGGTLINNETLAMDSRGSFWSFYSNGSYDGVQSFWNTVSNVGSYDSNDFWRYDSGQFVPNWTITHLAAAAGLSINGENAPIGFVATTAGMWILGENINSRNRINYKSGAKQLISATVNTPVMFAETVLALALEDNTTDSSPYGNTMTANNSPGTVAAVFGNGYSSTASSSLTHLNDSDFNVAAGVGWYAHYWINAATDDANDTHFQLDIDNAAPYAYVVFDGDGTMSAEYRDSAGTNCSCASVGDISDGEWHHIAAVWDGVNVFRLYTDGVENCNDTDPATAATAFEDLIIGNNVAGGRAVEGLIDDFVMGTGTLLAESVAKIHAEGRKKLGMGTPVFAGDRDTGVLSDAFYSNNVVDIDALDNGMWAVAFSDANTVQVFDGRIPVQQIAAPAGTVASVALIQSPGTDSVGVAIGTTTNLKFVQPSVNLRAAMAHQYKEPTYVGSPVMVDSAGIGGIFWTGDDAIDAAYNASRSYILFAPGTYGPFDADQVGQRISGSGPGSKRAAWIKGSTADDAIDITASEITIENFALSTTEGGGNTYSPIECSSGSMGRIINNYFGTCDHYFVDFTGCTDQELSGNQFKGGSDGWAISVSSAGRIRIINNYITDSGGLFLANAGDNNIIIGNIAQNNDNRYQFNSGANYNILLGNAYDDAGVATNNGTGNVIEHNEGSGM